MSDQISVHAPVRGVFVNEKLGKPRKRDGVIFNGGGPFGERRGKHRRKIGERKVISNFLYNIILGDVLFFCASARTHR